MSDDFLGTALRQDSYWELRTHILKLRWMRLDAEADEMAKHCRTLAEANPNHDRPVPLPEPETD